MKSTNHDIYKNQQPTKASSLKIVRKRHWWFAFTIAAILGHSTIQMSARYTHATDERKRRAVENMSRSQKSGHIPVTQLEAAG